MEPATAPAARYGGDEFALVLPEADRAAAAVVASRIRRMLAADAEHPPLSASTGCAMFPDDGETTEALTRSADREPYQSRAARQHDAVQGASGGPLRAASTRRG